MAIQLVPAYGRTYDTGPQAWEDWEAGKDFRILGGPYCSIRDREALQDQFGGVQILYAYPADCDAVIEP